MNREELKEKLELARVGNGTQTYNDVVLTLSKEETLELCKYIEKLEKELKQTKLNFKNSQTHSKNCYKKLKEKFERGKEVYHRNYELIQENGKLKQENQELKERYKKRAELSNELCEALKKYEKAFEILEEFVTITKGKNEETGKWDIPIIYSLGLNKKISQKQYELLKRVFESVGEE